MKETQPTTTISTFSELLKTKDRTTLSTDFKTRPDIRTLKPSRENSQKL